MKLKIALLVLGFFLVLSFPDASAWFGAYNYRYQITVNTTSGNNQYPFSINDSFGLGKTIIWSSINGSNNNYAYCSNAGCINGNKQIANATTEKCWENENSGTGNCVSSIFGSSAVAVYHFGQQGKMIDSVNGLSNSSIGTNSYARSPFNNSIYFGTSTDVAIIPDNDLLDLAGSYTITLWLNITSAANSITIQKVGTGYNYEIAPRNTMKIQIQMYDGTNNPYCTGATALTLNTWYHVATVYNKGGTYKLYINGVEDCSVADSITGTVINTAPMMIGGGTFIGSVDEIRIYNTTKTQLELQQEYYNGINNATRLGAEENNIPGTPTKIDLWLNRSASNLTMTYGDIVNITAKINVTNLNVEMTSNAILFNNDTTISYNMTNINWFKNNTFEIKANFGGNASHGSSSATLYIKVLKQPTTLNLTFNGTNADTTITYGAGVNVTGWDSVLTDSYVLSKNGTVVSNPYLMKLGASYYNFTINYTHENYTASPVTRFLTVNKNDSGLVLSVSPSWSVAENTPVTIGCSIYSPLTRILYKNGITVSNPYSATLTYGNYNFTCVASDNMNYTPGSSYYNLAVTSGGFGCSDNTTFAFRKSIDLTEPILVLNFTTLVSNHLVRSDLSDIWINATAPNIWKNVTNGYLIIINNSGLAGTGYVYFGNYINRVSYPNNTFEVAGSNDTLTTYEEVNPYYNIDLFDELEGTYLFPPGANNSISLYCSGGSTTIDINDTQFLVAAFEKLADIKITVTYSSTEIYWRNLIARSSVEDKNFYLVDANLHQVVEMVFTLQDNTGDFSGSIFKIKKWMEGTEQTITEMNFDAQSKAVAYLVNGEKYQLYVDNGAEERGVGFLYIEASDLSKTVVVGHITTTNITQGNVSVYLNLTGGAIVFTWLDPGSNTNLVEFWVYNDTNGTQYYYASSTNRSRVSFTYIVPDPNGTYRVKYSIHHGLFGNDTYEVITSLLGSWLYPVVFPLTAIITNLGGSGIVWLTFIFILPVPMLFTEKFSGVGAFVFVVLIGLLVYWKQYSLSAAAIGLGLFFAFLIELKLRRNQP